MTDQGLKAYSIKKNKTMNNKQIRKIMLEMGGHCKESLTDVKEANSEKKIFEVLFDYIKPCMEKDFPTYNIMEHFKISGEPYGVFVDSRGEFIAKEQNILYGDSTIALHVRPYDVVRIYLKHISHAQLKIGENAIVILYKFDKSTFEIIKGNDNKLIVRDNIK